MALNTPLAIIKHVAFQMSDCEPGKEFERYTQEILLEYLNLSVCAVSEYRPDLFTNNVDIVLQPGSKQELPDTVENLVSVDGASSESAPTATESDFDLQKAFPPSKCANRRKRCVTRGSVTSTEEYSVSTYSYDPNNPGVFYVTPEVPPGQTPTVTIQAVQSVTQYTLDNLNDTINFDCAAINPIIKLMQAKAHELDREAIQNYKWAEYYNNLAWAELRNTYQQQAAHGSGWYLGQQGSGDQNARRR